MSDSEHSYGHGEACYWCGYNPDTEPERPCDERLHKKPTDAQMNHYECVSQAEEARDDLERAEATCEHFGYRETAKELYAARLLISEAIRRLETMRPPG